MKKIIVSIIMYTVLTIIIIPYGITYMYRFSADGAEGEENIISKETLIYNEGNQIKVLNPETQEVVETPFEDYIKGVVGAEMPALFPEEALKAQAVAARTYAVKKIEENKGVNDGQTVPYNIGQAYMTKEQLKDRWGIHFDEYYEKVSNAVDETAGEIIVYEDEPILAVFHSTSAGMTETSENVWGGDLPYLKTVDSSEDLNAPDFITETSIPEKQVVGRLQERYKDLTLTEGSLLEQMQIIERTQAGYIKNLQVGNKIISGVDFREVLGLRSSNFTIKKNGENIVFITKGYGHGAGMSQYGAGFMADAGQSYVEILKHYYQGVEIVTR